MGSSLWNLCNNNFWFLSLEIPSSTNQFLFLQNIRHIANFQSEPSVKNLN